MWKSRILQFTIKILIQLYYDIIGILSVDSVSNHCILSLLCNNIKFYTSWLIINSERDGQLLVLDHLIHQIDRTRDSNHYCKICIDNFGGRAIYKEDSNNAIMSKTHKQLTRGIQLAKRGF